MLLIQYDRMKTALKQPYKQFFGTLANQARLDIISQLRKGESNVSDLVTTLGLEQSTVSHSLKRLELCGFVEVRQNGKERIYKLNEKTIKPLFELMHKHMNSYCKHVAK